VEGVPETTDRFGTALAAGDFDHDGRDDLAIGVPLEDIGTIADAGWVNLLYGTKNAGLSGDGDQIWHQNISGVEGVAEAEDEFGSALTVGDFDDDGFDDLAVGDPSEGVGEVDRAGAVNVLYGSGSGITASGDQYLPQNTSGIDESSEDGDEFGTALAAGDFDDDGHDDLAIGVPFESVSNILDAGGVNVLYGVDGGLSTSGDQFWSQSSTNIEGVADAGDQFGSALSMGDFNRDGAGDLAIGVPFDDLPAVGAVPPVMAGGAVNVIYGSGIGLAATNPDDQYWHQNVLNLTGVVAKTGDRFGFTLR
jgi:hypothetical protein